MSVVTGQTIAVDFTTRNASNGAAAYADSLPTGTLVVSGTDNAASVTVSNVNTGIYKAAVTLPTLTIGQTAQIRVQATVNAITDNAVIWTDICDFNISSGVAAVNTAQWNGSNITTTTPTSTLAAGAKMDIIDAPNATAVAAIQSGLSKPGTAQTITPADTFAATLAQNSINAFAPFGGSVISSPTPTTSTFATSSHVSYDNVTDTSIVFSTGANSGVARRAQSYNATNGAVTVYPAFPNAVSAGDNCYIIAVPSNGALAPNTLSAIASTVWNVSTSALTLTGSIGKWLLAPAGTFFANIGTTTVNVVVNLVQAFAAGGVNPPTTGKSGLRVGDYFNLSYSNLGDLSDATDITFEVQRGNPLGTGPSQAASIVKVSENSGLIGVWSSAMNSSYGSLVVTNSSTGTVAVTIHSPATLQIGTQISKYPSENTYTIRKRTTASYPDYITIATDIFVILASGIS